MAYSPAPDLVFQQPPAGEGALVFASADAATADLVFNQSWSSSADLVFGAADSPAGDAVPPLNAILSAGLPPLALTAQVIPSIAADLSAVLPGLSSAGHLVYQSYAARPTVGKMASDWQAARSIPPREGVAAHSRGAPFPTPVSAHFEAAAKVSGGAESLTSGALVKAHPLASIPHADAQRLSKAGGVSHYAETLRDRRTSRTAYHQDGSPVKHSRAAWHQDCMHDRRTLVLSQFGPTLRKSTPRTGKAQSGKHRDIGWTQPEHNAWVPRPGIYTAPVEPPTQPRIGSPDLLFWQLYDGSGNLIFNDSADPAPVEQIVVPVLRAYIVINQTTIARADDGTQIPAENLAVNFDCDSWLPAFSATIPADALDAVMPSPGPVEIIATINTVHFRFFVEKIQRNRAFGKRTVSISGRGVACELDAPYALTSQYLFAGDRTAQQMIGDALQYTGYSQTWGVTDWLIPGGTFSVSGAPITVAQAVAEASGSVLAAHWSSRNLRMLPRYKAKPWEWGTTTPDIILPADVVQTEGIGWSEKPDYNAVFISGTTAGVIGHVKRTGTAGDVVAPMVTHPLITHADAARQRGTALLSDTGRKTSLQLSLPVLPETGVIDVCKLIQFNDGTTSRRGIVRANSIAVNFPTVRQTLTIEAQA